MSNGPMSREDRRNIIMEDFRWLDEVKVHSIEGKLMLGDNDLPYNVGHVFLKKEFIEKWLMGFALGNDHGINYFPIEPWCALTGNGTRAVLVVDDESLKPVLLVPPLVAHKLTARDFTILRMASWYMHANSADTQRSNDPNLNLDGAKKVAEVMGQHKRVTYTEMIAPHFYETAGIVPVLEKRLYFIKDIINQPKLPVDQITKARPILYKHFRGEKPTKEEIAFIMEISKGSMNLSKTWEQLERQNDDYVEGEVRQEQAPAAQEAQAPSNPMEC